MKGLRSFLPMFAVTLLAISAAAWGDPPRREGTSVQGKVVRVSGNSFLVDVGGGKQVTLYSSPKSTYRLRDRDGRFEDIRAGMSIRAIYDLNADRNIISSVTLADEPATSERSDRLDSPSIRGRIMKASSDPNHLVIQTADGKELILYLDGKREGAFSFETREGKRILTGLSFGTVNDAPAATAQPTAMRGTIVRVAGPDRQFVVRTEDGKEVIFYADPKMVYEYDGREAEFTTLRPGVSVNVDYAVRDSKHYARRITGRRR